MEICRQCNLGFVSGVFAGDHFHPCTIVLNQFMHNRMHNFYSDPNVALIPLLNNGDKANDKLVWDGWNTLKVTTIIISLVGLERREKNHSRYLWSCLIISIIDPFSMNVSVCVYSFWFVTRSGILYKLCPCHRLSLFFFSCKPFISGHGMMHIFACEIFVTVVLLIFGGDFNFFLNTLSVWLAHNEVMYIQKSSRKRLIRLQYLTLGNL